MVLCEQEDACHFVAGGSASANMLMDADDDVFDHSFSGWSIWLEPEEEKRLDELMRHVQAHGSTTFVPSDCGIHPFSPHVTLLYNLEVPDDPVDFVDRVEQSWQQIQQEMRYHVDSMMQVLPRPILPEQPHSAHGTRASRPKRQQQQHQQSMSLEAYDWYCQDYPKTADNGKGFGCSIVLLLIERTQWMQRLHQVLLKRLGPDERTDNFIPHMSLVYAPPSRLSALQKYVQWQQEHKVTPAPFAAKYLSIWDTRGRINEWKCIHRIPLIVT